MLECSISARLSPLARLPQGQAAADVHRKAGADNRLHAATPITCMSVGVHLLAAVTSLVLQTLCNCLCRFTLTLQLYLAWRLTRPVREERLGAAASIENNNALHGGCAKLCPLPTLAVTCRSMRWFIDGQPASLCANVKRSLVLRVHVYMSEDDKQQHRG